MKHEAPAVFSGAAIIECIRRPESLVHLSLRQWDVLLRVCRRANLLGRLAEGIEAAGIDAQVPKQVRPHLVSARVLTAHQREAIVWETRHIEKALSALQAPVVLLKGTAYAIRGLAAAHGRLFGDVDILVPRPTLNSVEAALMVQGWASGHHDDYDDRYYREWMHEIPPMTHRARGTVIDVHHNILPLIARNSPDADMLFETSQPVQGTKFRTLSSIDMVIHSATHLFHESELQNGLRDLFDLDALLREFSAQSDRFWEELPSRATRLGLELPLLLALRYTRALLGTPVPEALVPRLQASARLGSLALRILDAIYLRALMPDHPASRTWSQVMARGCVYLRGHALRMPAGRLTLHLTRKLVLRMFRNTSRSH
ncbi:nucleotidyltransferase family protein [Comamonadaceae bacterium G21597-S1]|nr:nucleotidyltransferase family protein [Comamonadaceae bacterium G21597-S1]